MSPDDTGTRERPEKELRVGIVGTGNVARRNYIPFLADQEDVSLAYLNRTPAKAEAVANEFGGLVLVVFSPNRNAVVSCSYTG